MTMPAEEDEFTELVGADFPRVDLVGKGANGAPGFLIMKDAADGLLEPGFIRELITKAEPGQSGRERVTMPSGVTLSGSPADIAAFIHKAAQRAAEPTEAADPDPVAKAAAEYEQVIKAKYSAEDRRKMASSGAAMDDGSYPIGDEEDLGKAIRAVGRGGSSHNAIRKHVISRARSLGASSQIPDNWAADGSLKEDSVAKSDPELDDPELDEGMDGLDPTVPLAAPGEMAPGDPMVPGSPAWESVDAATACKWMSIAARLKNALSTLAERELIEAAVADPGDAEAAWDLQDAMCAVDYVIGVLACFAAGEQAEVDLAADTMSMIGKALASFDTGPLETVEGLAPVAKSGRVLSAANEAAIRAAHDSLQKVLMSLPQAPAADDQVTKEAAMAADQTQPDAAPADPAEVAKAEDAAPADPGAMTVGGHSVPVATPAAGEPAPVAKEDGEGQGDGEAGEPMCVVYDCDGKAIGIVDPSAICPVQGAADAAAPAADEPGTEAPEAPASMDPVPSAEAGTPADEVAKQAAEGTGTVTTVTTDQLESIIAKAVAAALDAQAPVQDIAKADVIREQGEEIEALKAAVEKLGNEPAVPKVFSNGAVPPQRMMRGQDSTPAGGPPVDVAKAAALRETLYRGTGPEQADAAAQLQQMADQQLAAIHGARR